VGRGSARRAGLGRPPIDQGQQQDGPVSRSRQRWDPKRRRRTPRRRQPPIQPAPSVKDAPRDGARPLIAGVAPGGRDRDRLPRSAVRRTTGSSNAVGHQRRRRPARRHAGRCCEVTACARRKSAAAPAAPVAGPSPTFRWLLTLSGGNGNEDVEEAFNDRQGPDWSLKYSYTCSRRAGALPGLRGLPRTAASWPTKLGTKGGPDHLSAR